MAGLQSELCIILHFFSEHLQILVGGWTTLPLHCSHGRACQASPGRFPTAWLYTLIISVSFKITCHQSTCTDFDCVYLVTLMAFRSAVYGKLWQSCSSQIGQIHGQPFRLSFVLSNNTDFSNYMESSKGWHASGVQCWIISTCFLLYLPVSSLFRLELHQNVFTKWIVGIGREDWSVQNADKFIIRGPS